MRWTSSETGLDFMDSRTIKDSSGRTLVFSVDDFIARICEGDGCFVCGQSRTAVPFNDEHVIPRWLLKRYGLFGKSITLPNGEQHSYGTYTMDCCMACNSLLGEYLENPMSEMLQGGFDKVDQQLRDPVNGLLRRKALFVWLCLLFIKTHLKDRQLRQHLDRRKGDARISDQYAWEMLHHIHCVARFPYVGGELAPSVVGTTRWFRIEDKMVDDQFDYFDLTFDHTMILRIGDLGVVAVLTDSGKCSQMLRDVLFAVEGQVLTMVQLRELGARLALANRQLLNRPNFYTAVDKRLGEARTFIGAKPNPGLECEPLDHNQLGEIMAFALGSFLDNLEIDGVSGAEQVAAVIKEGRCSFFLDDEMRFMSRSTVKPS